jgi:hypothetical protein
MLKVQTSVVNGIFNSDHPAAEQWRAAGFAAQRNSPLTRDGL